MNNYHVIGLMSGTSLDGLDIVYCEYSFDGQWQYKLLNAECIDYSKEWKDKLNNAIDSSALELQELDIALAEYFSLQINAFIKKHSIQKIDFISSHGHTIFHQPEKKLSLQIGAGQIIAQQTGITCICDFRKEDVAMGGQGAPLVPIGDRLLFGDFDYCLNIGGIANISYEELGERIAFDICPANMLFNFYAEKKGQAFDENGKIAAEGTLNAALFEYLNNVDYYSKAHPKSLGKEIVFNEFINIIESLDISIEDKMASIVEHVAFQIAAHCTTWGNDASSVLITGGGAHHKFLIERIKNYSNSKLIIPSEEIINYKEAIVFGFLGVLRMRNENNCLRSVTGASHDHCSGLIYLAS